MGKTLYDYVTNEGKCLPFGGPTSEELTGRTARFPDGAEIRFDKEPVIKCDDDLFLAEAGGKLLLVKEQEDESLEAQDIAKATAGASALPGELEGWETDLSFASGFVLTGLFKDGALTISESPEPVVGNPFGSGGGGIAAPQAQEALPPLATLALKAVETDEKRFIFCFPETGDAVIFNARRFLLYAFMKGRVVTGFVEVPPRDAQ